MYGVSVFLALTIRKIWRHNNITDSVLPVCLMGTDQQTEPIASHCPRTKDTTKQGFESQNLLHSLRKTSGQNFSVYCQTKLSIFFQNIKLTSTNLFNAWNALTNRKSSTCLGSNNNVIITQFENLRISKDILRKLLQIRIFDIVYQGDHIQDKYFMPCRQLNDR